MQTRHRTRRYASWALVLFAACCFSVRAADDRGKSDEPSLIYSHWETFTTKNGLPDAGIWSIHVADAEVWVGTDHGLALWDKGTWRSWTERDGLPYPTISAIHKNVRTNDVWLGTWGGGLVRFSAGRFDRFHQFNSGLPGDLVFDVTCDDGRIWASTNAGVSSYDPNRDTWEVYAERRSNETEGPVTSLIVDAGKVFGGEWHGEVWRFDPLQGLWISPKKTPDLLCLQEATRTEEPGTTVGIALAGGTLWRATQNELHRSECNKPWDSRAIRQPTTDGFTRCIASDGPSEVWLGTDRGLRVLADWDTESWITYQRCTQSGDAVAEVSRAGRSLETRVESSVIPDNRIRCIGFGEDDIWIGTVNGLAWGRARRPFETARSALAGDPFGAPQDCRVGKIRNVVTAQTEPHTNEAVSVSIAVLGPRTRTIALPDTSDSRPRGKGLPDILAVQLALEDANARGGERGKTRFRLTTSRQGYARYGWGTPEDDFPILGGDASLVGIVAFLGVDDRAARAVSARSEIPIVTVSPRPIRFFEEAGCDPWIFRCNGDEPRQHRLLLHYLWDHLKCKNLAVLRTTEPEAKRHFDWWTGYANEKDRPFVADLPCSPAVGLTDSTVVALKRVEPDALLTWSDATMSASILNRLRDAGMGLLFVGGRDIVCDEFISLVGNNPGPVLAVRPSARRTDGESRFAKEYADRIVRKRGDGSPGDHAYRTLDSTDHLLYAINASGPDRWAVRRQLEVMESNVTGEKHYERSHQGTKPILTRLQDGRWRFEEFP